MFRQITAIGIQFDQKFNYLVENGDIYSIRIKYIPDNFEENDLNKIGWFYLTLDYNDIRICTDRKNCIDCKFSRRCFKYFTLWNCHLFRK